MICPKCGKSISKLQCDCGFDVFSCNTSIIGNRFKTEVVTLIESIQESEEYLIIIENVEQKLDKKMKEYAAFVKEYEKGVEKLEKAKASIQDLNSFMEDNLTKERQYKKEINNYLRKLKELEG